MKRHSQKERIVGFKVLENECIWMKAGVINFRICDNDFDCATCPFDQGMRRAMDLAARGDSRSQAPHWIAHLKARYDGAERPCRHVLTGRVEGPKICPHNYECYHCAFDQILDEMDLGLDPDAPGLRPVAGVQMADGYYYHLGHSWARFEHSGRVRVGCDDFAARVFGDLRPAELPPLGERLVQGEVGWSLARDTDHAAFLAPVTGRVLAVNHRLWDHPEIMRQAPYHHGWLFILEPDAPRRNLKALYFGREAVRWMDTEQRRLLALVDPGYDRLAATGGQMVHDVHGRFPHIGWETLVVRFLHTRPSGTA